MNDNYNYESEQTTLSTAEPTVEIQQSPDLTSVNGFPNTTVITGPTFRIKGSLDYDMNRMANIVNQTMEYASEHQVEAANLAYAMNKKCQENGYPTNICVSAGPIFDIDLTENLGGNQADIVDIDLNDND